MPAAALTVLTDLRREAMLELLQLHELIDLAIPRGGEGLIRFVAEHARVPVIKHYKGVCHLFVDASADPGKAIDLLVDGKCSRPAACNSLETLLVHREVAETFLPRVAQALGERGVQLRADAQAQPLLPGSTAATEEDYAAEFLDLVLAVRVVDDLEAAIAHIRTYTSDHTEVIATEDASHAERFVNALRSAVVMVNASSRFSDGGQLGLGSEIGISTTRLHAYGPMGLEALTVERFVVRGEGQTRRSTPCVDALRGRPRCRPRSAPTRQAPTEVGIHQVVGLHHLTADADRPCVVIHVQGGGLAAHQPFGQSCAGPRSAATSLRLASGLGWRRSRPRKRARLYSAQVISSTLAHSSSNGSATSTYGSNWPCRSYSCRQAGRRSTTTAGSPVAPTGRSRSPRTPG